MFRRTLVQLIRKLRPTRHHPDPHTLIIEPEVAAAVNRQPTGALTLTWTHTASPVNIYIATSPDDFNGPPILIVHDANTATLDNLPADQRYYFKLAFADGTCLVTAERILPLPGGVNLRDIGGYEGANGRHVRWGQIYRSGDFSRLKQPGQAYLQSLGINLVCDLRTTKELEALANQLPADIKYVHYPVYERTRRSTSYWIKTVLFNRASLNSFWVNDVYIKRFVDGGARVFGDVLRLMANGANRPMVVHCTAGKDRTGITVALLLSVLGVERAAVVADYTLSNRFYEQLLRAVQADTRRMAYYGIQANDIFPMLTAQAPVLEAALDHINRKYGSVEDYLLSAGGLDAAVLEALRRHLLA